LAGTPQEEFAHSISHSGEHLLSLVNSVLDLAKVEAGKMTLHLAAQDVSEVVRHTIDGHLSSAMKKHLDLRFELDPALPRRSLLDRMRLVQVLNNLIHNAIKFTEKGVVKITASMERDGVLFDIADTGPGIDPAIQKTLFQKFVQADGSEQRHHEGTGLALARELVELMGGRIWLESEPGKGSHFKFTLPVAAA
jgi:signal transduction histidine kinase